MNMHEQLLDSSESQSIQISEETSRTSQLISRGAGALRCAGGGAILLSALIFLLQGPFGEWPAGRLGGFLVFLSFLGLCGFITGLGMKETRGARIFLGLATFLGAVAWAQLGGLFYARFAQVVPWMPTILRFSELPGSVLLLLLGVTACVTGGIAYAGYSVLMRQMRRELTAAAVGLGLLLVLPVRDPGVVALGAAILLTSFVTFIRILRNRMERGFTKEEYIACATLLVPVGIVIGRSWCYASPAPLIALVCGFLGLSLTTFLPRSGLVGERLTRFASWVGFLLLSSGWVIFCSMLFFASGPEWYLAPFGVLPSSFWSLLTLYPLCAALYLATEHEHCALPWGRVVALLGASYTAMHQLNHINGTVPTVMGILVGIVCCSDGYHRKEKWSLCLGAYLLIIAVSEHIKAALTVMSMSPWLSLGLLGVGILFLSSYLQQRYERKG